MRLQKKLPDMAEDFCYTSPTVVFLFRMAEKFTECIIRGVVDLHSLRDLIPILQVRAYISITSLIIFAFLSSHILVRT
jgi:hypothetical protein